MTKRVLPENRLPGIAERTRRRAEFKARKASLAANPSSETLARRAVNAARNRHYRANRKAKKILGGRDTTPFTLIQLEALTPAQIETIAKESHDRLRHLTAEQRDRFKRNAGIFITAWLSPAQFNALVEFGAA